MSRLTLAAMLCAFWLVLALFAAVVLAQLRTTLLVTPENTASDRPAGLNILVHGRETIRG